MKRFVVRLRFHPDVAELATLKRVVGLAKLPSDQAGHPSGQWSIIADLWGPADESRVAQAWLSFASPNAPAASVLQGAHFDLFVGPKPVCEAEVLLTPHVEGSTFDDDFLRDREAPARKAA